MRCIELVRLYVIANYHGKGAANALMEYAFDFAKKNGYQVMYLSVWEYNFRARGFYEKHGFINSGIENDFPLGSTPQTDYWFVKRL
jgi:ribosomal protein S18 acetylase RimI-like enzyme